MDYKAKLDREYNFEKALTDSGFTSKAATNILKNIESIKDAIHNNRPTPPLTEEQKAIIMNFVPSIVIDRQENPATEKQTEYIKALGGEVKPMSKQEASEYIEQLKTAKNLKRYA
jgi:formate dehydrogenase maturation protein FdhE